MSAIDSLGSLVSAYESSLLTPAGGSPGSAATVSTDTSASGSAGASAILSELESSGITINGVSTGTVLEQAEYAAAVNADNSALQSGQTNVLAEFYSYADSLSSAADTLSSETDDPSGLSFSDISAFVSSYNNLVGYAGDNTNDISQTAADGVKQTAGDVSDALSAIGITANSDGTLSIDADTLQSALESDPDAVASTLSSLASKTKSASQAITSSPLSDYAASLTDTSNGGAAFYNYINAVTSSSITNTLIGQLFDTSD